MFPVSIGCVMVRKKESTDRQKFVSGSRGKYVVADMPEHSGRFLVEELVAEIRRTRPSATLVEIAGEYGESERNFRYYLKGNAMPLGKGRRFARRLRELHLAAVARLERRIQLHPRGDEAAELLRNARRAYEEGYETLAAALGERENIVTAERAALILKRTEVDTEVLAQEASRIRSRSVRLMLDLARSRNLFLTERPPPDELLGYWANCGGSPVAPSCARRTGRSRWRFRRSLSPFNSIVFWTPVLKLHAPPRRFRREFRRWREATDVVHAVAQAVGDSDPMECVA